MVPTSRLDGWLASKGVVILRVIFWAFIWPTGSAFGVCSPISSQQSAVGDEMDAAPGRRPAGSLVSPHFMGSALAPTQPFKSGRSTNEQWPKAMTMSSLWLGRRPSLDLIIMYVTASVSEPACALLRQWTLSQESVVQRTANQHEIIANSFLPASIAIARPLHTSRPNHTSEPLPESNNAH